jgi:predicted transcriptional regulator
MNPANAPLGDLERDVLRFIAEQGDSTVGEVAERFGTPRGLARTTVQTVMERLRKKGYLAREERDGVNRYRAMETQASLMRGLVQDFVQRILGGSITPFAAYLTEADELSEDELAALQRSLAEIQLRRKESSNER